MTAKIKWHFDLHDGKGGIIIYSEPMTAGQVMEDCRQRFGERRLKSVT